MLKHTRFSRVASRRSAWVAPVVFVVLPPSSPARPVDEAAMTMGEVLTILNPYFAVFGVVVAASMYCTSAVVDRIHAKKLAKIALEREQGRRNHVAEMAEIALQAEQARRNHAAEMAEMKVAAAVALEQAREQGARPGDLSLLRERDSFDPKQVIDLFFTSNGLPPPTPALASAPSSASALAPSAALAAPKLK